MSFNLIVSKLLEQGSRDFRLTSLRKKMKHYGMPVLKSHQKMTVMCVIWVVLILLGLMTLISYNKSYSLQPSSSSVVQPERSYPTKKSTMLEKLTDVWAWDLWGYMSGSSSVTTDTKQPQSYTDGLKSTKQSQTKQQETSQRRWESHVQWLLEP